MAAREAKKQKRELSQDQLAYIFTSLQLYFANYLVLWFVVYDLIAHTRGESAGVSAGDQWQLLARLLNKLF